MHTVTATVAAVHAGAPVLPLVDAALQRCAGDTNNAVVRLLAERARAAAAILTLAKNPRPAGSRKLVGTESDYRIVYEIADEIRIVRINRVRHRRDVYR